MTPGAPNRYLNYASFCTIDGTCLLITQSEPDTFSTPHYSMRNCEGSGVRNIWVRYHFEVSCVCPRGSEKERITNQERDTRRNSFFLSSYTHYLVHHGLVRHQWYKAKGSAEAGP